MRTAEAQRKGGVGAEDRTEALQSPEGAQEQGVQAVGWQEVRSEAGTCLVCPEDQQNWV